MQKTVVSGSQHRVEYIDLFRGIGILLMILGHLELGIAFDHYIHAFNMPMFFFVSGFFFKSGRRTASFVRKKTRSLLLPYAVFGAGHYLINILMGGNAIEPLKHLLFANTFGLPITGAIWFLTALFITELAYHLLDRFVCGGWRMHLSVIIIALAGNLLPKILPFRLPWAMDAGFVGVGLYHAGRLFKEGSERENSPAKKLSDAGVIACLVMLVIGGILIFTAPYINMRTGNYGNIPMFWINALLPTIAGMILCCRLFGLIGDSGRKFLEPILRMGRNSIVFLCTNEFFLYAWKRLIGKLIHLPWEVEKAAVFAMAMLCMFIAERILTGTNLRILIGRK